MVVFVIIFRKTIVLEKLEGRREDLIHLPSGKIAPGLSFYYVTKSVMKNTGIVKEIKAIQTALNAFEIHYASNNNLIDNVITNNHHGIHLSVYNDNNTISDNTVINNEDSGIELNQLSDNNTISGNTINNNGDVGIHLYSYHTFQMNLNATSLNLSSVKLN